MSRLLTVLLVLLSSCAAVAEGQDLQKVVQETQRFSREPGHMSLIWWIPNEYWEISWKGAATLTPEQQKEFIGVVDGYLVFAVVDVKVEPFAALTMISKEEIQKKITVFVQGQKLMPLAETELSQSVRNVFQMMKPMISNMLGQFGQGMEFIAFKGKNAKGERYADPKKEGFLTLELAGKAYKWRLPLGSLLPQKYDPKTGEDFPGNYEYSPFTAAKLVTVKPDKTTEGDVQ